MQASSSDRSLLSHALPAASSQRRPAASLNWCRGGGGGGGVWPRQRGQDHAGVQDSEDHEGVQAGQAICWSPVHGVHGQEQLAGPLPARLPHHDRDARVWQP